MKPIAMRCTQQQFDAIKPKLEKIKGLKFSNAWDDFITCSYLVNNYAEKELYVCNTYKYQIHDYNRTVFDKWDEQIFLEYCGYKFKDNKPMTTQKLTVPITDVLEIHKIACKSWKIKIAQTLTKIDKDQNITFTQSEVDEIFKAATPKQLPVLERIFGKKVKEIDWDKIKTGSKVMIQYTDQHCNGIGEIDITKPVTVVFYKTPFCITASQLFQPKGTCAFYCTFYQNGNYVLFGADKKINYITEVIEY